MRRILALLAAVMLSACTTETVSYVEAPMPTASPAYAASVRPGGERLMVIDRLYAWCERGVLVLQVTGTANTGGWSDPRLNRVSNQGGLLVYEFIAQKPGRAAASMLEPFTVRHEDAWPTGASRVRVVSQTNEMTAVISPCPVI